MIHIYRSTSCLAYDRPALQRAPLEEGFHDGQVANSPPTPKKKSKNRRVGQVYSTTNLQVPFFEQATGSPNSARRSRHVQDVSDRPC